MATRVQDHPNYGMDVHTVQREMSIPLRSKIRLFKATVQTLNAIRQEIGLYRLLAMLSNVKRRVDDALQEYDFSRVRALGLSERDLREILDLCWWNGCVVDDVFFPGYMAKAGGRYSRDGTLATGAPTCDFCYEQRT